MKQIRLVRVGLKEVLTMAEQTANSHRHAIAENWDKERSDKEARKAIYKAHRGLAKAREIINECQRQLWVTKRDLRKLNHQHDMRVKGMSASERASK